MNRKIIGVTVGTPISPRKIEDEIKPVKTVNGNAPDKNGNVEVMGNNGSDGKDGFSPTISVSKITGGHRITITDKNDTKTVDVMDGTDGKDGEDGKDGSNGTNGTNGTNGKDGADGRGIKSVARTSGNGSAGTTDTYTITYTDNTTSTFTVYNGKNGTNGKDGVDGKDYVLTEADKAEITNNLKGVCVAKNQGSANVGKILAVGTDGNLILVDMPEGGASGDVIGTIDENNNIILTGELAKETYTIKYENADGSYTDIGTLDLQEKPKYTNFADPSSSDWAENSRLNSSATVTGNCAGCVATNFIRATKGQTVEIKGVDITDGTAGYIHGYDGSKGTLGIGIKVKDYPATVTQISQYHYKFVVYATNTGQNAKADQVVFVRFSGKLETTSSDVIITVDEAIV